MTGSGVVTKRPHEMKMEASCSTIKYIRAHSVQYCTVSPLKRQLRIAVCVIVLLSVFELTNTV